MAMLHLVNKSPFERNALESCLGHAKKGASVLLLEDGVYAAMNNTKFADKMLSAMHDLAVYVLDPDLKARGMDQGKLIDGVKAIDYGNFVDLVTEHDNVQSWL
jgi:tRNA 2-thiouridine synthesizing protein B